MPLVSKVKHFLEIEALTRVVQLILNKNVLLHLKQMQNRLEEVDVSTINSSHAIHQSVCDYEWGFRDVIWHKLTSLTFSAWAAGLVWTCPPGSGDWQASPKKKSRTSAVHGVFPWSASHGCCRSLRAASCLWQMRSVWQRSPAGSWRGRSWCTRRRWHWRPTKSLRSSRRRRDSEWTAPNF